jgi:poly(3-hydroxybutyrate) depolymerase
MPKKGPELKKGPPEKKEQAEKKGEKKDEKPETGLLKRANAALGREYYVYVPTNYDPNIAHGLIVWFHAAGKGGKDADDLVKIWQTFCEDFNFVVVAPKSQNNDGWVASETEAVMQDVKEVMGQYTIDRARVVAHGMGIGGQMAFYVGFNARDTVRAVATTGAVLGTQPKDNVPTQQLSFYVVGGEKDPLFKDIAAAKPKLAEKKYPVVFRQIAEFGKEYLDQQTLLELMRWMDSLDRI